MSSLLGQKKHLIGQKPLPPAEDCMRSYPQEGSSDFGIRFDQLVAGHVYKSRVRDRMLRTKPHHRCKVCNLATPEGANIVEWTTSHKPFCKDWAARREMFRQGWIPVQFLECWENKAEPATYFRNGLLAFQLDTDTKGRTIFTETSDSIAQRCVWVRVWAVQIAWEVWVGAYNGKVPNATAATLGEASKCVRRSLEAYSEGLGNEDPPEEMRRLEQIFTLIKRQSASNVPFWNDEWFRAWQPLPAAPAAP